MYYIYIHIASIFAAEVVPDPQFAVPGSGASETELWCLRCGGVTASYKTGVSTTTDPRVDIQHGSLNVPIEHHPTIRYMVYNGYYKIYKVMSNIPKMGQLPTPVQNHTKVIKQGYEWDNDLDHDHHGYTNWCNFHGYQWDIQKIIKLMDMNWMWKGYHGLSFCIITVNPSRINDRNMICSLGLYKNMWKTHQVSPRENDLVMIVTHQLFITNKTLK
jgi:hypothetical protein